MPFRFRKIFKLGKGFKINLSKSGFSASIGKPGATLNLGKRGPRFTAGIPGTGISHTSSLGRTQKTTSHKTEPQNGSDRYITEKKKGTGCLNFPFQLFQGIIASIADPNKRRGTLILIGSILGSCILCIGALAIFDIASGPSSTPTPQLSSQDIIDNAVRGIQDSFDQTAAAVPTFTPAPTDTLTPSPTNTLLPTNTLIPTSTTAPLPTATIIIIAPTQQSNCHPSYPDVCIPYPPPDLDCGDIPYRRFRITGPDVHNFDGSDGDGIGCES